MNRMYKNIDMIDESSGWWPPDELESTVLNISVICAVLCCVVLYLVVLCCV
jgi:endonuclease III-like uncharacterized protein